jgi:hypothetical protein
MRDEAEILFQQEIQNKQRERHNLRSKTGSKGSSRSRKGVRTSYDFLSTKERKNLSSEVTVKNLFDLLLTRKEFDQYPKEKQKEILIHWRDIYPNSKIMEALEIKSQGGFNTFLQKLDVPKKRSWSKKPKPQPAKKELQPMQESNEVVSIIAVAPEKEKDTNPIIFNGLQLNYNGVYNCEEIEKILTKLQLLVSGEENDFIMSITLQEKK